MADNARLWGFAEKTSLCHLAEHAVPDSSLSSLQRSSFRSLMSDLSVSARQGDHTWATMLGQSVRLQPVPIQSLSELERARLQEVALYHLEERDLDFKISIPKGTDKGECWDSHEAFSPENSHSD